MEEKTVDIDVLCVCSKEYNFLVFWARSNAVMVS